MNDTIAPTRQRSAERIQFLSDILVTAVEHAGYGFIEAGDYEFEPAAATYAVIRDRYILESGTEAEYLDSEQRIDLDTIAKGLGIIRRAVMREVVARPARVSLDKGIPNRAERRETVLHNAATGQRLYMSPEQRRNILECDRTNGEEGDYDVLDALAIVECALFGEVRYG